ncbi:MAG: iron-containing alcohol dehydrogenase [Nitrososphaerota archaeon]
MKTISFSVNDKIPPREVCGCGFPHHYNLKNVLFGNVLDLLELLPEFDMSPPYGVFYDEITFKVCGKQVVEQLNAVEFNVKYPTFDEAETHLRRVKDLRTIIAVGGGAVIDVARYVTYRAKTTFVVIPTAPSQDGIASPRSALYAVSPEGELVYKGTAEAKAPDIVIFDLDIVSSAPITLIRSGYGDILTKLTSIKDWQLGRDDLGEPYCPTAEKLALEAVESIINVGSEYKSANSIMNLCKALILSGAAMGIVNSTRPGGGSEHMIGRHLEIYTKRKLSHGIAAAVGTLLMASLHELKNPNWWSEERYKLNSIRERCEKWDILKSLKEANIPRQVFVEAITESWKTRPERYTILHKYKPERELAEQLVSYSRMEI